MVQWGHNVDLNGKKSEKFQPLMCKNSENVAKLPISAKWACGGETARGHRTGGTGDAQWPVVRAGDTPKAVVSPARAGEFYESNLYEFGRVSR